MENITETKNKVYAVSDLHGDIKLFHSILKKIDFKPNEGDELYVLGDIINGKSHGLEIMEYIMNTKNVHFTLGNHDKVLLYNMNTISNFLSLNVDLQKSILDIAKNYEAVEQAVISFYNANLFEGSLYDFDRWFHKETKHQKLFSRLLSEMDNVDDNDKITALETIRLLFNADPFTRNGIYRNMPTYRGGYNLRSIILELCDKNLGKEKFNELMLWLSEQQEFYILVINGETFFLSHSSSVIDFHGLEFHWGPQRVEAIKNMLENNTFDYYISGHSPAEYVWRHLSNQFQGKNKFSIDKMLKYRDRYGNKHIVIDINRRVAGAICLNSKEEFYTHNKKEDLKLKGINKIKLNVEDEFITGITQGNNSYSLKEFLDNTNYYKH